MRVILERYALTKPIGSGGMGTLWEGTDIRLNRRIAVKQIRRDLSQDHAAMRRFTREAQITARLSHPGVPVIYDFGTDGEELFIAMEYVDGVTIAQLIDEVVPVPIGWAAAIVTQVCAVLAAAHEQQLVHRDLKPANVMIRPDGSVKVLDFGLAAALDPGEFSLITQVGETPGTAFYIAPEVASGEQATPASDLYSVGCLLYELLTGSVVFAGLDPVAEIEAHLSEQPPLASAFRSDIPADVDMLARELLAKSPFGRPPDAHAVVERLLPLVADLPPLPDIVEPSAGLTPAQLYSLLQPRLAVVTR
ncbi:MAG TPA: serine/threonine-protein kinase [Trebonia sp.]|jgi:non-specific serine/threonine protein kinase|nr:serine/threonine-protein kinase [Trebonia sp.]